MSKVYLAFSGAPDRQLGHIDAAGNVYRSEFGPDDVVGHVHLASGKVYAERFGPDKKLGHVDLESGKVYISRAGLDEYVGRVDADGTMHAHKGLSPDRYVAKVETPLSRAHTAAAMLLLVLPALDEPTE